MPGFFKLAVEMLEENPNFGLFCGEAVLRDGRSNEPFGIRPAVRPVTHAGPVRPEAACRLLKRTDNWILTGSTGSVALPVNIQLSVRLSRRHASCGVTGPPWLTGRTAGRCRRVHCASIARAPPRRRTARAWDLSRAFRAPV